MSPIKFTELQFDHIVEFTKDNTIFAAARERNGINGNGNGNGNGHLRLFLITSTGNVYTRNGRADSWQQITGIEKDLVLARVAEARHNHIPVYRINGSHN